MYPDKGIMLFMVHFWIFTATHGELWYLLIGVLIGLIVGVHMAVPRYRRGRLD